MSELRLNIREGRQGKRRAGHPWIYKRQLRKLPPALKPGDMVAVTTSTGAFIGRGYYNSHSDIAVRLITMRDEPVTAALLHERLRVAFDKRASVRTLTNAYRAVFSEADGLPGLVVDIYADTAVVQILTLGMERWRDVLIDALRDIMHPRFIFEKSPMEFRKREGLEERIGWWGEHGSTRIEIREGTVRFLVDILQGHKTGFYLDQRRARMALKPFVNGKRVLDLFSYTGGFGVSAAAFGAAAVTAVDIKKEWLTLGRENATLNNCNDVMTFVCADAFTFLEEASARHETFDVVIVDPPSFVKQRHLLIPAVKGYTRLNAGALRLVADGGMLATFSCSHHMSAELFATMVKDAARAAPVKTTILKRCHQAEDHPIVKTIPESEYLKGYFLRVTAAGGSGSSR